MTTEVFRCETDKSLGDFVADLASAASRQGFFIHNESKMEMAHTFGRHGVRVAEDFDLHMIQICKPQKAARSLGANPERAVLLPKFVVAFSRNGKTQIRFLRYGRELIAELVEDESFPDSLSESFAEIVTLIEAAA